MQRVPVKYSLLISHAWMPIQIWHQFINTGTTNPWLTDSFFQIINSLIESFGLKLTYLGCKRWILYVLLFYLQYRPVQTDATRNRCSKHRWSWLLTSIPESRNTNTGKQIWMSRNSQSIKIGKSDLIDIDCIDQMVEIDDTLVSFIDLSWFLPISSIFIGRYICPSVHPKMKTDFMQTVNLSTAELQLRVEGSNNYITFKKIWKILSFLQNQV